MRNRGDFINTIIAQSTVSKRLGICRNGVRLRYSKVAAVVDGIALLT
jgi:hypothetical protein